MSVATIVGHHDDPLCSPANIRFLVRRKGITEAADNLQRSRFISYRRGQISVLDQKWIALRLGNVKLETDGGQHQFEVQMYLDNLDPEAVQVELSADGADGAAPERVQIQRARRLTIRRASYRTAMTRRFRWSMLLSCGSGDSIARVCAVPYRNHPR